MAIITATSGEGIVGHAEKFELGYKTSIAQVKSQGGRRSSQRRGPLLYTLSVSVGSCRLNSDKYYSIMEQMLDLEYGANTLEFTLDKETDAGMSLTTARGLWDTTASIGFSLNNEDDPNKLTADPVAVDKKLIITAGTAGQTGRTMVCRGAYAGDYTSSLHPFTPVVPPSTADGRDQTGVGILIGKKFDYVQFDGSTKVYQLTADAYSDRTGPVSENCTDSNAATVNSYSGDVTFLLNTPLVNSPDVDSAFSDVDRGVRFGSECKFNMMMAGKPNVSYHPGDIVEFGDFTFEEVITDT
jgi:hypothetical protein